MVANDAGFLQKPPSNGAAGLPMEFFGLGL
jgi:hypothetical protein